MSRVCVRVWSVCVLCVVVDDSLVENGQSTPYGPCGLGAVGGVGAEEVCNAAGKGFVYGGFSRFSAHDALASLYAAECACAGAGVGAPYGSFGPGLRRAGVSVFVLGLCLWC
jgi:hypothetical protein